ncbi:hypothetical protein, partial [Rurimicrobium arvi]
MKKVSLVLAALLILISSVNAQDFRFMPDAMSQRKSWSDIIASFGTGPHSWPYTVPSVASAEFNDLAAHSGSVSTYTFKSVRDKITIGVDPSVGFVQTAYKYKVQITVQPTSPDPSETVVPFNVELELSYNPDSLQKYQDLASYTFQGRHKYSVQINQVWKLTSGMWVVVSPDQLAKHFFIQTEVITQRYDLVTRYVSHYATSGSRYWQVNGFLSASPGGATPSGSAIAGLEYKPALYELEWTYVDDYQFNRSTGTASYAFPANSVVYNFKRNATRIQLDQPLFKIPVIYEHGALVHRWRLVRPSLTDFSRLEYGPWSLPDQGTLSPVSTSFTNYALVIDNPHSGDSLNWQYTINFAEQGKYKHVINYFDGTLKDRQTQTRLNTNLDQVIGVDKVLDYEGRPAIVSLPTPISQQSLYYNRSILLNSSTSNPYQASDIDQLPGCSRPGAFPALAASSVANIYYSSANPDKSGMQQFVPDAEGYPLVQTVYSPDNTNKVLFQGGAGMRQQLWNGHGTQYEYTSPLQPELDKYLGNEAGKESFYTKQIVTDPNGQSSYSILNHQGKVTVSGLQGASPSASLYPLSPLANFVTGETVCTDLLKNAQQTRENGAISSFTTIYNDDNSGGNTLEYRAKTFGYLACINKYIFADANVDIKVFDDCGVSYPDLAINGSFGAPEPASVGGTTGLRLYSRYLTSPVRTYNLPKGKFMIEKRLSFSESQITDKVKTFIKENESICYKDEDYFIRAAVEQANFPCRTNPKAPSDNECDKNKREMMSELYPKAKYGPYQANADGSFKDQLPNSIFSVIMELSPYWTDKSKLTPGTASPCAVKCTSTPGSCDDADNACGCTDKHMYSSYCCTECLFKKCSCIMFPLAEKTSVVEVPKHRDAYCNPKSFTNPILAAQAPFCPSSALECDGNEFSNPDRVNHWNADFIRPDGSKGAYEVYTAILSVCDCGEYEPGDTIWHVEYYSKNPIHGGRFYTHDEDPTIYLIRERDLNTTAGMTWGHHYCDHVYYESENITERFNGLTTYYRYQSPCLHYPDIMIGGVLYHDADIKNMDPEQFRMIFNDQIAEALLPLHPEYCKLLACGVVNTDFEEQFSALENVQQAKAKGMYNLADIVAKDPLANANSLLDAVLNYTEFLSPTEAGINPIRYFPLNPLALGGMFRALNDRMQMDHLAMIDAYCGLGKQDPNNICAVTSYASEICGKIFTSPEIEENYFQRLKGYYLSNHNMLKQQIFDNMVMPGNCSPCLQNRMTFVEPAVFSAFSFQSASASGAIYPKDDEDLDAMGADRKKAYLDALNGTNSLDQAALRDEFNEVQAELQGAQVSALLTAFANCGMDIAKEDIFTSQIQSQLANGALLSPEVVRNALIAAFGSYSSAASHMCHPFLYAYGLQPDIEKSKREAQNFTCRSADLYTGLKDFMNDAGVISAIRGATLGIGSAPGTGTASVSFPGNAFTDQLAAVLSIPVSSPWPPPGGPIGVAYPIDVTATLRFLPDNRIYCGAPSYDPNYFIDGTERRYLELKLSYLSKVTYLRIHPDNAAAFQNLHDYVATYEDASDPVTFTKGLCLNESNPGGRWGVIGGHTAMLYARCSTCTEDAGFWVMAKDINFMDPVADAGEMDGAITCLDIKNAINQFQTTDKTYWGYGNEGIAANHPLYMRTLTNYLNYHFNKQYQYDDYVDLMKGCALSDYVTAPKGLGTVRVEVLNASADDFETKIKAYCKPGPDLFRYVKGTTSSGPIGNTVFLIDMRSVSPVWVLPLWNYINGVSPFPIISPTTVTGVVNVAWNYHTAADDNLLFTPAGCTYTLPAGTSSTDEDVLVRLNGTDYPYKLRSFHLSASSPAAKDKADLHAAVDAVLHGTSTADVCSGFAYWTDELYRADDYATNTLRQQYLSYVYSLSGLSRPAMLAAIAPSSLPPYLGSYGSFDLSYSNPYLQNSQNNLYAYVANPSGALPAGYALLKNTILSAINTKYSNKPFPELLFENVPVSVSGAALAIAQKANGVYWYRYFDADDHMYNVYLNVPDFRLGRSPKDFVFTSVEMGMDPHFFTVTLSAPATAGGAALSGVKCLGYADFVLGDATIASNVLLNKTSDVVFPFDTSDCEKSQLLEAVYNGKAAYQLYFDSTVRETSKLMMSYLLNYSKDTLLYCGRQQQYQQTLYYYDLAGNLSRTVPPMGVQPLSGFDLTSVDKYRDGTYVFPAEYWYTTIDIYGHSTLAYWFPNYRLTNHKKVSYYRYNSLNQLIYQKTPDGNVTYFFYDAAGRQIFSQNSKQRIGGLYTYNLYDAQGRPEESGEVRLGCTYPETSTADFDLSPCSISYKKRDLTTAVNYAAHPDFVTYSYDNVSYPYDDLRYFIQSRQRMDVVRTIYDDALTDLSSVSGAMLRAQENLRGRVSSILFFDVHNPSWGLPASTFTPTFATHYSYDLSGNVKTI